MKCPRCQGDNRDGARFCRECGATFAAVCPSCGAKVEAGSKFCDSCGAVLAAAPTPTPAASRFATPATYTPKHLAERILTSKAALEGERKRVTVLGTWAHAARDGRPGGSLVLIPTHAWRLTMPSLSGRGCWSED